MVDNKLGLRIYAVKDLRGDVHRKCLNPCPLKSCHTGQSTTEFILMLALMSVIGIALMKTMIGPDGKSGAINGMAVNGTKAVQSDPE